MGWVIELAIDWLWIGLVERLSKGKPWWVWTLWALSPVFPFALLVGVGWLLLR